MHRTVTSRNLLGGFLGGALGILATGYLHPAALPFGCLLGVVFGWWYERICYSVWAHVRIAKRKTSRCIKVFGRFVATPVYGLKEYNLGLAPITRLFHFVMFVLVWPCRLPSRVARWKNAHPVNHAVLLRVIAGVTCVVITVVWFGLLTRWLLSLEIIRLVDPNKHPIGLLFLVHILAGMMFVLVPLTAGLAESEETFKRQHAFYRLWEQYAKKGPRGFFWQEVGLLMAMQVCLAVVGVVMLAWFVTAGGLFVLIVVIPIAATLGLVKGVYYASTQRGHWLCFGVTLATTLCSAWFASDYFASPTVLWSVALATGVASGVLTEFLRRTVEAFYHTRDWALELVATPVGTYLSVPAKMFGRASSFVFRITTSKMRLVPA